MNSKKVLGLAIAAVIVLILGFWIAGRQTSSTSETETLLYPKLKSELGAVDVVRLYKAGDVLSVELVRKNDAWTVTERSGYAADVSKLRKLLQSVSEAKLLEEKTSTPENYPALGVEDVSKADATGLRVAIPNIKSPVNLIVGKSGPGAQSQYVRRVGEPKSWLVSASIEASTTPETWIRKEIADVSADRVQSATVTIGKSKPYSAAKKSRADANFTVEGLPKGKALSSESAANSYAAALAGLTLADVQQAAAFDGGTPAAHSTIRTFDGLVLDLDGWTKDDKHYISVKAAFDQALADQFKPPAPEKKDEQKDAAAKPDAAKSDSTAKPADQAAPATPNVSEEASTINARTSGWIYEIPQYKYDAIFKPVDELVKK
jgi:hypothetical protein